MADESGHQGDKKYGHLLQPIRDLAQNWNIDVAHDLEEYLEELSDVEISFDGGKTSLNFAQAALLIQGSACIYSRKVEYLYTLIYQTLDMITTQSRRGKRGIAESSDDGDALAEEAEEEFLLLDDVLEEGRPAQITLSERPVDVAATAALAAGFAQAATMPTGNSSTSALSSVAARKASAALMSRTPLAHLAATRFDAGSGGGLRLASTAARVNKAGALLIDRGEGAGSNGLMLSLPCLDVVDASSPGTDDSTFNGTAAVPGPAGRCVLDYSRLSLPNLTVMPGAEAHNAPAHYSMDDTGDAANTSRILLDVSAMSAAVHDDGGASNLATNAVAAPRPLDAESQVHAAKRVTFATDDSVVERGDSDFGAAGLGDDGYYGDDGDDDGDGAVNLSLHFHSLDQASHAPATDEAAASDVSAAASAGAIDVNQSAIGSGSSSGSVEASASASLDPWAQLDPFATDPSANKPFRKARTYIVLRNARLVASSGPLVAAAAAMADAAASGKGGKDAKALQARATALAAKASALAGSGSSSTTTGVRGRGTVGGGGSALALAAAALALHRPSTPLTATNIYSAPPAPPQGGGGAAFPELDPLLKRHVAAVARGRAVSRKQLVAVSPAAAAAGAAYDLGGGSGAGVTGNAMEEGAAGFNEAAGAQDDLDFGAAGLGDDGYYGGGEHEGYYDDDGDGTAGLESRASATGGIAAWLDDADAPGPRGAGEGPSSAFKARELAGAFGLLAPLRRDGDDADATADFAAAVSRYMDELRRYVDEGGIGAGATSSAAERKMHARVADWQSRLEPVLEAEAARREFDMRTYGDEVMGRLLAAAPLLPQSSSTGLSSSSLTGSSAESSAAAPPLESALAVVAACVDDSASPSPVLQPPHEVLPAAVAAPVPFAALVGGGGARHEVCRTFLAALQLAADGNVEIIPTAAAAAAGNVPQLRRGRSAAGGDVAWQFSQAVVFSDDDEGSGASSGSMDALMPWSSMTADMRRIALNAPDSRANVAGDSSTQSPDASLIATPAKSSSFRTAAAALGGGFAVRLLCATRRAEFDGSGGRFLAPSAAANMAKGMAADAGYSGSADAGALSPLASPATPAVEAAAAAAAVSSSDSDVVSMIDVAPLLAKPSRRARAAMLAATALSSEASRVEEVSAGAENSAVASPPMKRLRMRTAAGGAGKPHAAVARNFEP